MAAVNGASLIQRGGEKESGNVGRANVCEGLEASLRRLHVILRRVEALEQF